MLNEKIFYLLNNLSGKNPIFDGFIIFSARYLIVFLFAFCTFFLFKTSKKAIVTFIFALILATLVDQIFRFFLPIERPFIGQEVTLLFFPPQDPSFPSNHAFLASVAAFSLFSYQKKAGVLAILAAVLIGLSRIVAGVHWPIDVLAGFLFGFLVSLVAKKTLDHWG